MESYPCPVKESQRYINLNPGRLFVQQPAKKGSRGSLGFGLVISAYNRGRQLSKTKINQSKVMGHSTVSLQKRMNRQICILEEDSGKPKESWIRWGADLKVQIPKEKGKFSGVVRAIQKHWQSSMQPSLQRHCRVRCKRDHSIANKTVSVSVLINQRHLLFWKKKCASSDNPVLRTLALCCRDAVGAVCDLYKLTTHDLVVLPVYIVKQLICDCFRRTVHT